MACGLQARGHSPHETAHFLVQLPFCIFAEDVGLLPNSVFMTRVAFDARLPQEFTKQTFALPWAPSTEPLDDPRVIAIGEAAK